MSRWGESTRRIEESFASNGNTREVVLEIQRVLHGIEKRIMENRSLIPFQVTKLIMDYITDLLKDLGFSCNKESVSKIDGSIVDTLCEFRTNVRDICLKEPKNEVSQEILHVCDAIRNDVSDRHGLTIIDGKSDVQWVVGQLPKKSVKAKSQVKQGLNASIPPSEMFRSNPEYSMFDSDGIPTHDRNGKPLSAPRLKKLRKQYATHSAIHEKWLAQVKKSVVC